MEIRCPHCNASQPVSDDQPSAQLTCGGCGETFSVSNLCDTFDLPAGVDGTRRIRETIESFQVQWENGPPPNITQYLPADASRSETLVELIRVDIRHRWKRGHGKPVEEYLSDFPDLRSHLKELFALFEEEYLVRHESEPHLTPSMFAQRYFQLLMSQGSTADSLLETCVSEPSPQEALTKTWTSDHLPTVGKFRLLSLAGKGAFGEVYRAHDTELDRYVALKLARSDRQFPDDDTDRSREEARNAARLSHPGIVPIFEVGRDARGTYIVSEFVNGVTLSSYLTGKRLHFTEATALVRKVALGLSHAHHHGVVHLDLKPSNLMIDSQLRPRILDFGMSRRHGAAIAVDMEGKILGTPRYMSPEQAQGNWHTADQRADIYSLGVIFFELLTNEPPFRGNYQMLLHQIKTVDPPSPRSLNHRLPKDLETIVLKCLEKEPDRRYQSADELVAELDRVQAGEPILARPITRLERGYRWCKKRPALVSWIGGLTSLIVLVTAIAFVLISQSRDLEREAKVEAVAMTREALTALDTSTTGVSEDLKHYPAAQQVRLHLLQKAANDYQRLAEHESDNPELRLEQARAWLRLGDLHRELGDATAAREAYTSAASTSEAIDEHDVALEATVVHSQALTRLSGLETEAENLPAAEKLLSRAREALEQALQANPNDGEVLGALIPVLLNQGVVKFRTDNLQEARQRFQRAVELGELAEAIDDPPRMLWSNVAKSHAALGELQLHVGEAELAARSFQNAVKYYQREREQSDFEFTALAAKAEMRILLAGVYRAKGNYLQERDAYRHAIEEYEALNRTLPGIPNYREDMAMARVNLGQWYHEQGMPLRAREVLESALPEFESLSLEYRTSPRFFEEQAVALDLLGRVVSDLGERERAELCFRRAIALCEELHNSYPQTVPYVERRAISRSHLAQLLAKQGHATEAAAEFEAALQTLQDLSQSATEVIAYHQAIAHVLIHYGDSLSEADQTEQAAEKYQQAITHWQAVIDAAEAPQSLNDLAWFLCTVPDVELRDPDRALALAQGALKASPDNPMFLESLAAAHLRAKDCVACLEQLDRAAGQRESPHGRELLLRAMAQAQQGKADEAQKNLQRAKEWIAENAPDNPPLLRLQQEAEQLLASPAP